MYKEGYQYDYSPEDYHYRKPKYISFAEKTERVSPLLSVLNEYSYLLGDLHKSSVSLVKLKEIQQLLKQDIRICSEPFKLLDNREKIQSCFDEIDLDIVLEKRRIEFNLPVYYCTEFSNQHFYGDYDLLLKDFYKSEYFDFQDHRFIPVTLRYSEKHALRLSQFQTSQAIAVYGDEQTAYEKIKHIGETVLQAMWDKNQNLAFRMCQFFEMKLLQQAIELIYLVNGTNVTVLRRLIDNEVMKFFEQVYTQPYVVAYLKRIQSLEGSEFKAIQSSALEVYGLLNETLSNLLEIEIPWGSDRRHQSLYKVLFANLNRLDQCAEIKTEEMMKKVKYIEAHIEKYVAEIIS